MKIEEKIKEVEQSITKVYIERAYLEGYQTGIEEASNMSVGKALGWLLGGSKIPKSKILAEFLNK